MQRAGPVSRAAPRHVNRRVPVPAIEEVGREGLEPATDGLRVWRPIEFIDFRRVRRGTRSALVV